MDTLSIPNVVYNGLYKPVYNKVILMQEEGTYGILKNQNSYVYNRTLRFCIWNSMIVHFSNIIRTLRLTHYSCNTFDLDYKSP